MGIPAAGILCYALMPHPWKLPQELKWMLLMPSVPAAQAEEHEAQEAANSIADCASYEKAIKLAYTTAAFMRPQNVGIANNSTCHPGIPGSANLHGQ
jgi:hypothetical protein